MTHLPGPTESDFAAARDVERELPSPHGRVTDDPDVVPQVREVEEAAESPHGDTAEELSVWRRERWAPHGDMNIPETGSNAQGFRLTTEAEAQEARAEARRHLDAVDERLDEEPEQPEDVGDELQAEDERNAEPEKSNKLQHESAAKASSLTSGPGPDAG